MNIAQEYNDEIKRLRVQRDVLREILVDEIQFSRGISRNEAEARADLETFQKMQRNGQVTL